MRRLVIRPGAIGDCLLSMPAIRCVRSEYTEAWVPSAVVPLFGGVVDLAVSIASTGLDLVGIGDLLRPAPLTRRLQSFDSVVSWYGANRPEFRDALRSTGVPCKFLTALPPTDFAGHAGDFFLEQVGAAKGLIPHLGIPKVVKRDTVVIHPFSGSARKNWPLERYRTLASRLHAQVEWTAGPEEQVEEARRFDDLYVMAEWIGGARLYIGNDSGITHLAAATGVKTLALFGPTNPCVWAPRGSNVTVLEAPSMTELPVERVWQTANRLLDLP